MSSLLACPFCRQIFSPGEVVRCPDCDVEVKALDRLPPSLEAQAIDPQPPPPPEEEFLPWSYLERGRGPLALLALAGIGAFFAPWLHERTPEIRTLSGFEFARLLPWLWAAGIAWMVMLVLVITRRTILHMRGARLAVGLMATMVLSTVIMRLVITPKPPHPLVPLRFEWGWGLYASGFLALLALVFAWRFGGSLDDLPSREARPEDEPLH